MSGERVRVGGGTSRRPWLAVALALGLAACDPSAPTPPRGSNAPSAAGVGAYLGATPTPNPLQAVRFGGRVSVPTSLIKGERLISEDASGLISEDASGLISEDTSGAAPRGLRELLAVQKPSARGVLEVQETLAPDIPVVLRGSQGQFVQIGRTDETGAYAFTNVPSGRVYQVVAGFSTASHPHQRLSTFVNLKGASGGAASPAPAPEANVDYASTIASSYINQELAGRGLQDFDNEGLASYVKQVKTTVTEANVAQVSFAGAAATAKSLERQKNLVEALQILKRIRELLKQIEAIEKRSSPAPR